MGVVLKFLFGEPSRMGFAPGGSARKAPAVAQKKRGGLRAFSPEVFDCCIASAYQIADRLVFFIGHPYGGEFAGPEEPCQAFGVAPVGLHVVAGPFRNQ
jgi:hypothetical protein